MKKKFTEPTIIRFELNRNEKIVSSISLEDGIFGYKFLTHQLGPNNEPWTQDDGCYDQLDNVVALDLSSFNDPEHFFQWYLDQYSIHPELVSCRVKL